MCFVALNSQSITMCLISEMYMLSEFEHLPQDFTFIQGRTFPFFQHSVVGNLDDSIAKTIETKRL